MTAGTSTTSGNTTTTKYTVSVVSNEQSVEDGEIKTNSVTKEGTFTVTDTRNTVAAGDNIIVSETPNADGSTAYTVGLSNNVDLTSSGSLTAGDTTISSDGITVKNAGSDKKQTVAITKTSISMGNQQVHNVAAGTADTDAVNVSQLKQAKSNFDNKLHHLNGRIGEVAQDANAGIAMALAAASLPQAYLPGKSMMAVTGGTYRGEQGYAVGFSHVTENGFVIKANASGNSQGHYGAAVGAGYMW